MTDVSSRGNASRPAAQSGAPRPRSRAGAHSRQAQATQQLSQSLPVLDVADAPQQTSSPVITFDHVTKIYPAQPNKPALSDISLQIYAGEFIFLVGHSGSGKTTFIRMLIHEVTPTEGHIYIANEDLTTMRNWRVPYLRRNIGCVFQDFKLLPNKTVFENVAFALEVIGKSRHVIKTQVPEVLRLVGLQDKLNKRPDQLSGGEQQRVSIARAIVNRPPLLICDEPTGNLDPQTSRGIMDLLERINRTGTTVLVATHDREMVDNMRRRVIALDRGRLTRDQDRGVYGFDVVVSVTSSRSRCTGFTRNLSTTLGFHRHDFPLAAHHRHLPRGRRCGEQRRCRRSRTRSASRRSSPMTPRSLTSTRSRTSSAASTASHRSTSPRRTRRSRTSRPRRTPTSSTRSTGRTRCLPPSRSSLSDPKLVEDVASQIEQNSTFASICGYDSPSESLKYGQKSVAQLFQLTSYVRYIGIALIVLLIFIALVFINNTIRLAILARRKEIAIMRLVGASNGFIRGPFLMEGSLHAIIGSLFAVGVLELLRNLALPKLAGALKFLAIDVNAGTFAIIYVGLVIAGLIIGLFGSALAMRRYLKV